MGCDDAALRLLVYAAIWRALGEMPGLEAPSAREIPYHAMVRHVEKAFETAKEMKP